MTILPDQSYGPHGERSLFDAYLPHGVPGPRPAVVMIHGGGWHAGNRDMFSWHGQQLAQRGIVALSITYRFWPEHCFPAQLEDVRRAVRWLRANAATYAIDPERIGGMGASAGAHLGSFLALAEGPPDSDPMLASYSSRLRCMVDFYGPVDLVAMEDTASAWAVAGLIGAPISDALAAHEAASPINHITPSASPFLILHGDRDLGPEPGQVPIGISRRFHARLQAAGADATLIEIPGADHGFSVTGRAPQHLAPAWERVVPFFERHLS
ncbi:MAG: alpha/beta hydrolase [Planctomycetota bacterium]